MRAVLRNAEVNRTQRIKDTKKYLDMGRKDIGRISKRDLFLVGLALYWGEGYKNGNGKLGFTNSDKDMIKFFIIWLDKIYNIQKKDLILRVSVNNIHRYRDGKILRYWSELTKIPLSQFTKTSFIKTRSKKIYSNIDEHFGTLRIKVRRGTNLKRRILGSIEILKSI